MDEITIVVSDLHAGDGGLLEDFHHDEAFGAFLTHYGAKKNARLILNGDTFDFLQTQPLGALTLQAVPAKMKAICAAHAKWVEALAGFTAAGNRIDVIEGNHDIELVFPEVQGALREELALRGGDNSRLTFVRSAITDIPGVHIEHGHQADPLNRFDYEQLLLDPLTGTFRYPWGSHFVMRVFNTVEPKHRFIDKVRPEAGAALLLYLIDRQLFKQNVPGLLGLKVEGWLNGLRLAAAAKPVPGKAKGPEAEAYAFAAELAEAFNDLQFMETAGGLAAGSEAKGVLDPAIRRMILRLHNRWATELARNRSYDFAAAKNIAERTGVAMVIFGHTHHQGRARVSPQAEYVNSGTWTPLLDLPAEAGAAEWIQEARDLGSYKTINSPSYVQIEANGSAELMVWDTRQARGWPAGY